MSLLKYMYFKCKDSANKGIFVLVSNDEATANSNMCVGDLASEPPSKWCRTQHSYDVTIKAEIGKCTYNDGLRAAVWEFSTLFSQNA